jgi:hypothetical protein
MRSPLPLPTSPSYIAACGFTEHVRNRLTVEANDRFVKSGVAIKDAYGTLDK